jgi:hypothetical protein
MKFHSFIRLNLLPTSSKTLTDSGLWRPGMSISENRPGERVKNVHFTEDSLSVPLVWYPRLLQADHQPADRVLKKQDSG